MVRTQIYLTEDHQRGLRRLSEQTGKSQSELIRQAIDVLLSEKRMRDRRALLRQAAGMWAGRDDLPDFAAMRRETDRGFWGER